MYDKLLEHFPRVGAEIKKSVIQCREQLKGVEILQISQFDAHLGRFSVFFIVISTIICRREEALKKKEKLFARSKRRRREGKKTFYWFCTKEQSSINYLSVAKNYENAQSNGREIVELRNLSLE